MSDQGHQPYIDFEDIEEDGEYALCSWCDGEGWTESGDPMWDGWDEYGNPNLIACPSCGGTGLAKDQTLW